MPKTTNKTKKIAEYNEFDSGLGENEFFESGERLKAKAQKAGLDDWNARLEREGLGEIPLEYKKSESKVKAEKDPFYDGI